MLLRHGKAGALLLTLIVAVVSAASSTGGPNMGIFDIPFMVMLQPTSTTSASSTTTPSSSATNGIPQATIDAIASNILSTVLYGAFSSNYGFVTVSVPTYMATAPPDLALMYAVVYNKTVLNNAGLLTSNNNTFTNQLMNSAANISSSNYAYDGYSLNSTATMSSMTTVITDANDELNNTAWVCAGIECTLTSTCYWNATMSMAMCVDKCFLFTEDNTVCTAIPFLPGVYDVGTCAYDQYWQPYCDCGSSVGNVIPNLYDGTQCASSTFIVAMSATAGGVVFLLCIALIVVINKQRAEVAKALNTATKYKLATSAVNGNGINNQATFENNVYISADTTTKSGIDDEYSSARL